MRCCRCFFQHTTGFLGLKIATRLIFTAPTDRFLSVIWLFLPMFLFYQESSFAGGFKQSVWTAKAGLTNANTYLQLSVPDPAASGDGKNLETLYLQPNPPTTLGGSVQYKSFVLSFEPVVVRNEESLLKKGFSEQKKFTISYADHNWVLRGFYHRAKGFYTDSPLIIDPTWTAIQPYPQFPKTAVTGYGTSFLYATDAKDFSAESIVNQSAYFLGGFSDSLLFGLNLGATLFSDLPAVTIHTKSGSTIDLDLKTLNTLALSPQVGYGFFAGFANLYIYLSSLVGPSLEWSKQAESNFSYATGINLNTMIGAGYHSSDYFLSVSATSDTVTSAEETIITRARVFLEIASGIHFK